MQQRLRLVSFLASIALGLTCLTVSASGSSLPGNPPASTPGAARFEEVTRTFIGDDGVMREVTVWMDPAVISQTDALAAGAGADLPHESDVAAAFVATRKWYPEDIPVVFRYNDILDPYYLDGSPAAKWAMDTWNAVKQQSLVFQLGEPTTVKTSHECGKDPADRINTVRFSDLMPLGVLAITCTFFRPQPGATTRITEVDMQYNITIDWWVEPTTPFFRFDLYTVMLHEFGHALGLGHSQQDTVMQPLLHNGQQVRTLTKDDIAGIRALYGVAATPTTSASATATKTPSSTSTPGGSVTPTATPTSGPKPFKVFVIQAGKTGPGQ